VNEAALLSARRNEKTIKMQALEDAIERVIAGPEKKSRVISDYEKKLVAYHEAGHAILGELLTHTDPLHKVSIIPRGRAGGYTLLLPREDRRFMTKSQMLDQIKMLLGGRVAEALVLKEISTGASNDLERATSLVRKMITELGMSEELGPLTFGHKEEQVFLGRDIARDRNYSEAVAYAIDKEARRIIDECYHAAETLISENIEMLHAIAEALMERETLEANEFAEIIARFREPKAWKQDAEKAQGSQGTGRPAGDAKDSAASQLPEKAGVPGGEEQPERREAQEAHQRPETHEQTSGAYSVPGGNNAERPQGSSVGHNMDKNLKFEIRWGSI